MTVICVGIKFYAGKSTNEITSPAFRLFPLPSLSIILFLSDLITRPQLFFLLLLLVEWDGRCALSAAHHVSFRTLGSRRPSFVCVSASAVDRVTLLAVDFIELCAVIVRRETALRVGSAKDFVCPTPIGDSVRRRANTHPHTIVLGFLLRYLFSFRIIFLNHNSDFFPIRLHRRRRHRRCRYTIGSDAKVVCITYVGWIGYDAAKGYAGLMAILTRKQCC